MSRIPVIDLHCHILPGLDDGPADLDESVAMARIAEADGVATIVATPHIRDDHPFDVSEIGPLTARLNDRLREADVAVEVVAGAEVAISKVPELDDAALSRLCIGSSRSVLVESPYTFATDLLERDLFDLQLRGFKPLLAHPERSPSFLKDLGRLRELVDRGVLCSVTSASLAGHFGRPVRKLAIRMAQEGLIHDVASDAHGPEVRRPTLRPGLAALERELGGGAAQVRWFVQDAPAAILADAELPQQPEAGVGWLRRWRRAR